MSNPKTFNEIDGVPLKYGAPGSTSVLNVRTETSFWGHLYWWKRLLETVSAWNPNYGSLSWFGHAGAYTCKSGMHGLGRAFDLNYVRWSSGRVVDLYNHGHAHSQRYMRRRYLAVDATCRSHFRWVLDGWYNAAHGNHIHMDDTTPPRFDRASSSDVKFLQAAMSNFLPASLSIDGAWGPQTQFAWAVTKSRLGYTTDIWNSTSTYKSFLTVVGVCGVTDVSF